MSLRPRKYGVKFFWLYKATTNFALKGMIYSGRKSDLEPHGNLVNDIVMKLCSVYFGTGRDMYVDRYFILYSLVCNPNLTLIGTIMANRGEVTIAVQSSKKKFESTKVLYDHSNKFYYCHMSPNATRMCL